MYCRNALVEKTITAGPDQTIAAALRLLERHGIRMLPVVDTHGMLAGEFSFAVALSNLLPAPLTVETHGLMDASLQLDFLVDADTQVAERLGDLLPVRLGELLDKEPTVVHPETPLWEGIRRLFRHGSPIAVVQPESRAFLGLLSVQSVMCELATLAGRAAEAKFADRVAAAMGRRSRRKAPHGRSQRLHGHEHENGGVPWRADGMKTVQIPTSTRGSPSSSGCGLGSQV